MTIGIGTNQPNNQGVSANAYVLQANLARMEKEAQTIAAMQRGLKDKISSIDVSSMTEQNATDLRLLKEQLSTIKDIISNNKFHQCHMLDMALVCSTICVSEKQPQDGIIETQQETSNNIKTEIITFALAVLNTIGLNSEWLTNLGKKEYEAAVKPLEDQIHSVISLLDKKIGEYDALVIGTTKRDIIKNFTTQEFTSPEQIELLNKKFDMTSASDEQLDLVFAEINQFNREKDNTNKNFNETELTTLGEKTYINNDQCYKIKEPHIKNSDSHKNALESLKTKEATTNKDIAIQRNKVTELNNYLDTMKNHIDINTNAIEMCEEKISTANKICDNLKNQLATCQKEVENNNNHVSEAELRLTLALDENRTLTKQMGTLNSHIAERENRATWLYQARVENSKLLSSSTADITSVETNKIVSKGISLNDEIASCDTDLNTAAIEQGIINLALSNCQERIEIATSKIGKQKSILTLAKTKEKELNKKILAQNDEVTKQNKTLGQLNSAKEQNTQDITAYKEEITAANTQLQELQTELDACQNDIKTTNDIITYHNYATRLDEPKKALIAKLTAISHQNESSHLHLNAA